MNSKTTIGLLVALVLLGGSVYVARQKAESPATAPAEKKPVKEDTIARDILDAKLGDLVKIVVKRKDEPHEWVFSKESQPDATTKAAWKMTAPLDAQVAAYEVDRIGNQLTRLQYDVSYKPGEPGAPTAVATGLEPAELSVALTDSSGIAATFEIGRLATENETYVRLKGKDNIFVAKSNLKSLVKPKAMEYRDLQLWTFAPEKATKVEIVDRSNAAAPMTYRFGREGAKWVMEAPVGAKATGKVDEMLRAMNRLRAAKWENDRPDKLAVYGLDKPTFTATVTVEEEVPAEKKDPAAPPGSEEVEGAEEKPATTKKVTTYALHLSNQSPIGDEAKNYIRAGEEPLVGTIAKTVADKFKPVMAEWRDMHVTTANVNDASRVEVKASDGQTATLVKELGRWKFDGQGGPAEDAAVKAMLKAVQDMTAVAFTEGESLDAAALGFQQPQAEIRLTVPGSEEVERIVIGGYTDPASKRLVYVRRNEATTAAKVKAADVAPLLQGVRAYRDRTVADIPVSRMEKLSLTAPSPYGPAPAPVTTTFEQKDGQWQMVAPAAAPAREDRITKLVTDLGALRAEAIVADEGEVSAYGLQAPGVRVQLTHKPAVEYRAEEKGAAPEGDAAAKPEPQEVQPPSQTLELLFAEHNGKYYAKRSDRPSVYQVSAEFYNQLLAELRAGAVLTFDDAKVRRFSIRQGDQTHAFEKKDPRWVYVSEPDLPLDAAKVQNLLLQLKDLKTERYLYPASSDLASWGLANPAKVVTIGLEDGSEIVLNLSDRNAEGGGEKGIFAMVHGRPEVFVLAPDTVERLQVNLQELETQK